MNYYLAISLAKMSKASSVVDMSLQCEVNMLSQWSVVCSLPSLILGSGSMNEEVIIAMRQKVSALISIHGFQDFFYGDHLFNASLPPVYLFLPYLCTFPINDMVFFDGVVHDG